MNKSHKVRVTKSPQRAAGQAVNKSGKAYRGANFVAQHEESAKKAAQRQAASRKKSK